MHRRCSASAHQPFSRNLQPIQTAQQRYGDELRLEQCLCHIHHLLRRHCFHAVQNFLQPEEVVEVHLLAGKIDMRDMELSSDSRRFPFNWSLARRSSSSGSGSLLSRLNSSITRSTTCTARADDVPANTQSEPVSLYGFRSL